MKLLRKPVRETTFFGMTIQAGADLRAFMTITRSPKAFLHATHRVLRHVRDLALHRRGMDLRNGNALVARLMRAALDLGVELRTGAEVAGLLQEGGRITGLGMADGTCLRCTCGVVLATGGYANITALRAGTFPRDAEHQTLAVPEATGDGIAMAQAIGARMRRDLARTAALCPVSVVSWPNGTHGKFPHIIERGKPGVIGVLANGKRFCNEGLGYHDDVDALLGAVPEDLPARSWLVCDFRFLRRFGLGVVRPQPLPWRHWMRRGYLKTGRDLAELARACGVDPAGLEATVAAWNRGAARGGDPLFHRGTTPYMRLQGDPEQQPNPCVATISRAPFFAVEVVPGRCGTFSGLAANGRAQVLDTEGAPIPGLWAVGTDMASVFGGHYPAGGINLDPAMTFGFITRRDAAELSA
nr:FAD-dependent oxidoreductase [Salipiger thiooxidans]